MMKRLTAGALLCYCVALCLVLSETSRITIKATTMAFSLVVVQRHRPIGASSGNGICCNSQEATIESDSCDHHYTDDCYVGNGNDSQQENSHPSFSRRKVFTSTTAGIVGGSITSGVAASQPAFASKGNDATITTRNAKEVVILDDRLVVRQYAGVFLEKMLEELQAGNEKGVEHIFRNLALFLSPPVTALDGGGVPLSRLRETVNPTVVEQFDGLSLNGARLADVILSKIPFKGKSAYDKDRVLVASKKFRSPSQQVDAIFASIWKTTPLEDFQVGRRT